MAKFYVVSGEVRTIISAPHIETAEEAACEAMLSGLQEGISAAPMIVVSEKGFELNEHNPEDDTFFSTNDILVKAGFTFEEDEDDECG